MRTIRVKISRLPTRILSGRTLTPKIRKLSQRSAAPPIPEKKSKQKKAVKFHIPRYAPEAKEKIREREEVERRIGPSRSIAGPTERPGASTSIYVAGNMVVLRSIHVPHTYTDKHGKFVNTDRWVDTAMVVEPRDIWEKRAALPWDRRGLVPSRTYLALSGPGWRCYYPWSTEADFMSLANGNSTGRLLNRGGKWSNYIDF